MVTHDLRDPFYFIRHGQTTWNREKRVMGSSDIPLSGEGIKEAIKASLTLRNEPILTICHSPLLRAKSTASIIQENLPGTTLVEIPELTECNWGSKEGHAKGTWYDEWLTGLEVEGAETFIDFMKRANIGLTKALALPGPVLIVAHLGINWSIRKFTSLDSRVEIGNCIPERYSFNSGRSLWSAQKLPA